MSKTRRKANLAASTAAKKSKTRKQNPFEIRFNREKHSVLNRKKKSGVIYKSNNSSSKSNLKNEAVGRPGIARSRAIQIRKDTLLQEYKIRHKSNVFVDRRIGEKDAELSAEDKMIARFTAERMKVGTKKNLFNLGEEENLTHYGQAISEIEQFDDDPRSDNEDNNEDVKLTSEMNFGGFLTQNDIEFSTGKGNSRKEWIEQMIADSKKRKLELQKDKEESSKMTQDLDNTWKSIYDKLKMTSGIYSKKEVDEHDEETDEYNKLMNQLIFEPKKAQAQERLKTDEEIVTEQKEMLEKLEELRQKRMKGGDFEEDNESDDDDNDGAEEEEEDEDEDESPNEDEFSDLEEESDHEESDKKDKPAAKKSSGRKKSEGEEGTKEEIPFTFAVPKSSEELEKLLQNKSFKVKSVIIQRMIQCNHPQFGKDNKAQLENLFTFLLQHIHDCADIEVSAPAEDAEDMLQSIQSLTPYLFDLAKFSPQPAAEAVRSVLQEKYEDYLKNGPRKCPSLDSLVFLKIAALLFPTTDYRHPVATPALQWMSHILSTAKPFTRKSLSGCLFVACLMTESVSLSKKFVPSLWNFLSGIIFMAVPKPSVIPFVPPFKVVGDESTLLVGQLGAKPKSLDYQDCISTKTFTEEFMSSAMNIALDLLIFLVKLWKDNLPSMSEILCPLKEQLVPHIMPDSWHPDLAGKLQNLTDLISSVGTEVVRTHTVPQRKKEIKILRLYDPELDEK